MTRLGLILTTFLAVIATTVAGAPVPATDDPCTILGRNKTSATYDVVAACFHNVPFNADVAKLTIASFSTLYDDFYVFRDAALLSNLPAPFTNPPVDIVKELSRIGSAKYPNDYLFHTKVSRVIASLNDAHAVYRPRCYNGFLFTQPLNLYAPVVDGKQSVRVYTDLYNRTYQDCKVTTIDGEPALAHLKAFADKTGGFSKDAGVRLNQILASKIYDVDKGDFVLSSGDFAERVDLPDKGSVEYELLCPSSASAIKVRDPWKILDLKKINFSDTPSYIQNVCTSSPTPNSQVHASSRFINGGEFKWKKPGMVIAPKKSALLEFLQNNAGPHAFTQVAGGSPTEPSDAVVVAKGNATVFYRLKSKPDVGVALVFTHMAEESEISVLMNAFETFHKNGVTKILIDFQANSGGLLSFGSSLVQAFFPDASPFDTALSSDLRVTDSILGLSNALFNKTEGEYYNALNYFDWETKSQYQSNELFQQHRVVNRGGRDANYTKAATLEPSYLPKEPQLANYSWTNKPGQIAILTDGRCGSACGMSTHYLHDHHNVKVYAIGGYQSQALSMFSFAGAAVSDPESIFGYYDSAQLSSPMKPLPYQAIVSLPLLEVYANNSSIPFEYDAAKYAGDVHIDFDSNNARSRDTLWSQVAGLAWA